VRSLRDVTGTMAAIMRIERRPRARTGGKFTVRIPEPRPAWALLTLVAWICSAHAADGGSPQKCAAIGDDRGRLACYDGIFRASAGSVPAGEGAGTSAVAAAATTAARPAAAAPPDDFGLTEAAKRARDPERAKEEMPESIVGTVAAVGRRPAGELVVTLENGQVWTQVGVDQRARVAAGDTVTIKRGALGSYMLVTESRYATRVRRAK